MTTRPFSPHRESAEELSLRTVGRDEILANLDAKLLSAATTRAKPHVLLVGPRGAGKSHVVEVALYRASSTPEFAANVVVVHIPEDSTAITRYTDLLQRVLRVLDPTAAPAPGGMEEQIRGLLGPRVVVLVIENLDRVFSDIGVEGQRNLRSWVETSGHVMLLATTPLLFPGVADRSQPWFGGLATIMLPDLTAAQGQELVARVARNRGDEDLREFALSAMGRARMEAIAALTGGSPRIWMILAAVVTKESLDELVPAVEDLLEGLVPYYQQLLWSLSPNERRLVVALAQGGAMTVGQVSLETEIDQRTAAKTLGRLTEQRWVLSEKPRSGDRRMTYYRVREPMLRYHLQYREEAGQPLELVVTLLRSLFTARERVRQMLQNSQGSIAEAYLSAAVGYAGTGGTLITEGRADYAYAVADWKRSADPALRQAADLLLPILTGPEDERATALTEVVEGQEPGDVRDLLTLARACAPEYREQDDAVYCLESLWNEALARANPYVLGLVAENLSTAQLFDVRRRGEYPLEVADRALRELVSDRHPALLRLTAERESGEDSLKQILDAQMDILGPGHPDTLQSTLKLADVMAERHDHQEAAACLNRALPYVRESLGDDHSETLRIQRLINLHTQLAAAPEMAAAHFSTLIAESTAGLRPTEPASLAHRLELARLAETLHEDAVGLGIRESLMLDQQLALGADHQDTLSNQVMIAACKGRLGDYDAAVNTALDVLERLEHSPGRNRFAQALARYVAGGRIWYAKDFATLARTLADFDSLGEDPLLTDRAYLTFVAWRIGRHSSLADLKAWEGTLGEHEGLLDVARAAAGDRTALDAMEPALREASETLDRADA